MTKWVLNYESGNYECIDRNGFSYDRGKYVYNWDDSEYRREEKSDRYSIWQNMTGNRLTGDDEEDANYE